MDEKIINITIECHSRNHEIFVRNVFLSNIIYLDSLYYLKWNILYIEILLNYFLYHFIFAFFGIALVIFFLSSPFL